MNLTGLTNEQVINKIKNGKVNRVSHGKTNSIPKILIKNSLTIFNIVNLILAIMVALVGSYKNMLFIFIAIANTLISVINEIRAKKTVDKMRLIAEQRPTVIRDGKPFQINQDQIVEGDLLVLALGDQVIVDCRIEEGIVEVNEAFVTGEQNNVKKTLGDQLISGSFIVSGSCKATATAVGGQNLVAKIESSAHTIKTADSKLFTLMNNIVKYISFALIPIGALVLWARFRVADTTTEIAVTSTVAALINMIPEGLVLLTSSVLALATIRLSRKKVLVQDLYAIETLARVDTIALDKTGTLTTGHMTVRDYIPTEKSFERALISILSHQATDNATITALKQKFTRGAKFKEISGITETIDFSSDRKYSGIKTKDATYLLGAIEFITSDKEIINKVKSFAPGSRTVAVVKVNKAPENTLSRSINGDGPFTERLSPVTTGAKERSEKDVFLAPKLLGVICLEDEIRHDAKDIVSYFYDNDIDIKIISGDDLASVKSIVSRVGVKDLTGIDLSTLATPINYEKLVRENTIFARVTPSQKKSLILALKKQGRTVAMTGDGVNDILAMKEADCSIAIGEGSDAARRSAKFVLLDSDFKAVPDIIAEGRQSINNLERSTALFLAKTVYASILAVIFVFLPMNYPFSPIEMSLLNFACIGFPGLILALEKNTDRVKNRFTRNILQYSFPVGLTVSICMAALSIIAHINNFSRPELTTASVFITFTVDLVLIYWLSRPLNKLRTALIFTIIGIMVTVYGIPLIRDFFEFTFLTHNGLIVTLAVLAAGLGIFGVMKHLMHRLATRILTDTHA